MRQVAEEAGVSPACVSLALRNNPKISPGTRAKVMRAADKIGYQRDAQVAQLMGYLRQQRKPIYSGNLAFLHFHPVQDVYQWWYPDLNLFKGAQQQAHLLGYNIEAIWASQPEVSTKRLTDILRARGIQGVLAIHRSFANRRLGFPWDKWCSVEVGIHDLHTTLLAVMPDYFQCGYLLAQQLLAHGYRQPAINLAKLEISRVNRLLRAGFETALTEKGILNKPVFYTDNTTRQLAMKGAQEVLQHGGFDAIVAWVTEPLQCIAEINQGRRPIGMAVFDAVGDWAGLNRHFDELGKTAVNLLVERITRNEPGLPAIPQMMMLQPTWVSGKSLPHVERSI